MSTDKVIEVYNSNKLQTFTSTIKKVYPLFLIYNFLKNDENIDYFEHTIVPIYLSFKPYLPNKMTYLHENSFEFMKRHDAYQHFLLGKERADFDKEHNFVFGLTAINDKKRFALVDEILKVFKDEEHIYIYKVDGKNKENNINTLLPREKYNSLIKDSRFTYIAEAYVKGAFSVTRLCDSVFNNCCPLFDIRCDLEIIKEDFGIDLELLKPVIVDLNKIDNGSFEFPDEETRKKVLEHLYEKLFLDLKINLEKDFN